MDRAKEDDYPLQTKKKCFLVKKNQSWIAYSIF